MTISGNSLIFTNPKLFQFDGSFPTEGSESGDVISVSPTEAFALDAATVSMSFEADRVGGTRGLFSRDAHGASGDGYHVSLFIQKGALIARFQNQEGEVLLKFDDIVAEQEYHTAITFGGGWVQLAVDGNIVDTAEFEFTWETSPEFINFGALGWMSQSGDDSARSPFSGEIGDLAIYSGVLSNENIAALANRDEPAEDTPSDEPVLDEPNGDAPSDDPTTEDPNSDGTSGDPNDGVHEDLSRIFLNQFPIEVSDSDDAISVSPTEAFALDAATVSMSFEADRVGGTRGLFSRDAHGASGDGYHVSLFIQKGTLIARFQNKEGEVLLKFDDVVAEQEYHTAITFGDGWVQLAVDGNIVDAAEFEFTWETSPEFINFGALGWMSQSGDDSARSPFSGEIGDLAIYSGVLSNENIAALANRDEPAEDTPSDEPVLDEPNGDAPSDDPTTEDPNSDGTSGDPTGEDVGGDDTSDDPTTEDPDGESPLDDPGVGEPGEPEQPSTDPISYDYGTVITLGNGTEVMTGRTSTLEHNGDDITSIRVLDKPDMGNLTVNPDKQPGSGSVDDQ